MVVVILCVTTVSVHAIKIELAPNGEKYAYFGGYLKDINGNKHTLNNINCYVDFYSQDYYELFLAIHNGVQDWNWHFGILNSTYGTNYSMNFMGAAKYESEITFQYIEDYIEDMPTVLAATYFSDGLGAQINDSVVYENANWASANIVFSRQYFDSTVLEERTFQMRRTVNHEIGHALGLAHDPRDNGILMYGPGDPSISDFAGCTYSFYDATADVPTMHDLLAVYYLYTG